MALAINPRVDENAEKYAIIERLFKKEKSHEKYECLDGYRSGGFDRCNRSMGDT
jgi:hypothetical protein